MGGGDLSGSCQVGYGAAHFKDSGIGADGKPRLSMSLMKQAAGSFIKGAMFFQQFGDHLRVAMDVRCSGKTETLDFTGRVHPFSYGSGSLARFGPFDVLHPHWRHLTPNFSFCLRSKEGA